MIFIAPRLCLLVPQANSSLPDTKTTTEWSPSCTLLFPTSIFDHLREDRKKRQRCSWAKIPHPLGVTSDSCSDFTGKLNQLTSLLLVSCLSLMAGKLQPSVYKLFVKTALFCFGFFNGLVRRALFQSMAEFLDPYYVEYNRRYFQICWVLEFKELQDGISSIISFECCKMCPSSQTNPPVKRISVLSNALPKSHVKAKWHQTDASGKCWLINYQGDTLTTN